MTNHPSVWLRYRKTPDAEPVDARFNPKPEPAVMASFLNECATRLGLTVTQDPPLDRALAARLVEYHR